MPKNDKVWKRLQLSIKVICSIIISSYSLLCTQSWCETCSRIHLRGLCCPVIYLQECYAWFCQQNWIYQKEDWYPKMKPSTIFRISKLKKKMILIHLLHCQIKYCLNNSTFLNFMKNWPRIGSRRFQQLQSINYVFSFGIFLLNVCLCQRRKDFGKDYIKVSN